MAQDLSRGMMKEIMKSKSILIKKYENRRLYDTVNSRYVNLEDVAKLLQQGDSVRVVDALSGEDITRLVLTQIIVEDAKEPNSTFPVEVLRQMVIASGRATQESAMRYMQAMLDVYEKSYSVIAPKFPFSPAPAVRGGAQPASAPAAPVPESQDGNLVELKDRVAELEALVATLSHPPAARRPAAKRPGSQARRK